ncbi:MAG: YihY/virulence factor BrkB family protein [Cellulophaga sp.]|uniref:YihY/virulence factor BrkB family protein n=1 Tax=unclassified Cellulophaga TaxID=2634405 RepID=UPI000C2BFFE5|nr:MULTISPECIES: YihY/virulence factor BrkB family protein [unclassified Cellulophaga]MDO6492951.1 YihY/virulence factor BrkB family protein [Cellulophaga sp. 2_MG-2023]MDO6496425.1 YihY/virulence factor BrkB family protein [Cellulophaga sp. 3_MG-2023]PKB43664.1 membrane protein [Cellulophaga sp. RHA19]
MSAEIEAKLAKIPVINWIVSLLKKVTLPAFAGLSLYDLIELYLNGILKGTLSTRASAIAFSLFMALFPLLIFLVTLIPFLIPYVDSGNPDTNLNTEFIAYLEYVLPNAINDYFFDQIYDEIMSQKRGGLLSSTFVLSIFLIANGVNAIFSGFENSYHVSLNRHFLRQYLYALMVGLLLSILIIVSAIVYMYFEIYVIENISDTTQVYFGTGLEETDIWTTEIAKVVYFTFLSYLSISILYYFGTAEGKKTKFFSSGSLMTTILFVLTSYLFGVYVDKFARYNELYGALGGLLILMVYIWLNANILLLGFELNATKNSLKKKIIQNEEE